MLHVKSLVTFIRIAKANKNVHYVAKIILLMNVKIKKIKKCTNCGDSHSAGFKGCPVFVKAKEINELSHQKKIT